MPCPKEIGRDLKVFLSSDCFCRSSTNLMIWMEIKSPGRDYMCICRNNSLQHVSESSLAIFQAAVWESKTDDMLRFHTQLAERVRLLPHTDFTKSNIVSVCVLAI